MSNKLKAVLLFSVLALSLSTPGFAKSISDETPPTSCGNRLVAGIKCAGSYCAKITPLCGPHRGYGIHDVEWTGFYSEEGGATASCNVEDPRVKGDWAVDPPAFITGFSCHGKYCDNVALECVSLIDAFPATFGGNECKWTRWVSEETPALRFPSRFGAIKMQCKGRYCDSKRFFVCPIQPRDAGGPPSVRVADFRVTMPGLSDPSGCAGERPADVGCTRLCKPCVTWKCEDGEWVRLELTTHNDPMCDPRHVPGPTACPRTPTGFCPAECSICF